MLLCHLLRAAARPELCGIILLCYSEFLIRASNLVCCGFCFSHSLCSCPGSLLHNNAFISSGSLLQTRKKNWEFGVKEKGQVREGEIQVYVEKYGFFSCCLKGWGRALKINSSLVFWILFEALGVLGLWSESCQSLLLLVMPFRTCGIYYWVFYVTLRFTFWRGGEGKIVWGGERRNRVGPLLWKPQDIEAGHISSAASSESCLMAACKELLFTTNICLTPRMQGTESSCGQILHLSKLSRLFKAGIRFL